MASNQENIENKLPIVTDVIREDLISTAVKFLTNANVQKSPVPQREAFLRKKGLTEKEIAVAFERSLLVPVHLPPPPQQPYPYQGLPSHTAVPIPYPQGYLLPPQTGWSRFRDIINTVAIVGGLVYGLYILYKRYIAPYLFGKKRSPVEESIASLDASVKGSVEALRTDLRKVQSDLEKINEQSCVARNYATSKQILDVKSEITSLKGLLLNRKQFPVMVNEGLPIPIRRTASNELPPHGESSATRATSPLVNSVPSEISSWQVAETLRADIPAWQLAETVKADQTQQREDLNEPSSTPVKSNGIATNGNDTVVEEV